MATVLLVTSTGDVLVPSRKEDLEKLGTLPLGERLKAKLTKLRSMPQHNLFFAAMTDAYENWPYGYNKFTPESPEHLRAWAECKVGHCDYLDFPLVDSDVQKTIELLEHLTNRIRAKDKWAFLRVGETNVRVYTSRTINHDECEQYNFAPVAHEVFMLLEGIIGHKFETFLKNTDAAA